VQEVRELPGQQAQPEQQAQPVTVAVHLSYLWVHDMATTTYKTLGQLNPSATTLSTLYTVPSATSAVFSTLSVCNQGVTTTFRVAVRPAGASIDPKHYLVYDAAVSANESVFLTIGVTLATTDVVSVYAGTANLSFNLFGSEFS
jgi:hypothetical protein